MSFNASAKRARDRNQPLGRRVACLCECLDRFSPFGFQTTRQRLRFLVGADECGWTEGEVVGALDILETARGSWKRYLETELERQRALKRCGSKVWRQNQAELFVAWRETYFVGEQADFWLVAGLGNCERCGHALIHHGSYACSACGIDPDIAWDERCRASLPDPG
jgi:hypothetical protein